MSPSFSLTLTNIILSTDSSSTVIIVIMIVIVAIFKILESIYGPFNDNQNENHYYTEEDPAKFNLQLPFRQKHLMSAYLCLSRHMLKKDMEESKYKVAYIRKHIQQKCPNSYSGFTQALLFHYKTPHDLKSVCNWINKSMPKKEDRLEILQFLTGISMVDGSLNSSEHHLLKEIQRLLNLEPNDLDRLIEVYVKREKEFIPATHTSSNYYLEKHTKTLGLSKDASKEDIKKAYRKLVMQYHPDKFENAPAIESQKAEEQFIRIQEAYEYLEKGF